MEDVAAVDNAQQNVDVNADDNNNQDKGSDGKKSDNNDEDKVRGNDEAKRFKEQAVRDVNLNDRNLRADVGKNRQFVFDNNQFQQQLLQFQNFDVVQLQQQFVQVIQQVQFNAWQQIAIQEFLLQQQLQQQLIVQQAFVQQLAFFQQQIVQNVVTVVQQHVVIIEQNVNVVNLGGFGAVQQTFVQQLGGLGSLQNLIQIGGGFDKFQSNGQLKQLFNGMGGRFF